MNYIIEFKDDEKLLVSEITLKHIPFFKDMLMYEPNKIFTLDLKNISNITYKTFGIIVTMLTNSNIETQLHEENSTVSDIIDLLKTSDYLGLEENISILLKIVIEKLKIATDDEFNACFF